MTKIYHRTDQSFCRALPDRFEQVGIVVGPLILVALPLSALVSVLFGFDIVPWLAMLVWVLRGLVIGVHLVAGLLPVTYHQVWAFSLPNWMLAFAGWAAIGLAVPMSNRLRALLVWAGAVGVGALIAWFRPVAALRHQLQHA